MVDVDGEHENCSQKMGAKWRRTPPYAQEDPISVRPSHVSAGVDYVGQRMCYEQEQRIVVHFRIACQRKEDAEI